MSIVHPLDLNDPAVFACAQSDCQVCLDALIRGHEGLVHVVLRRQMRGGVPYQTLLQEGRIAVWKATLRFDTQRGVAFSSYAGVAIERRIWAAVARANRSPGCLALPEPVDPSQVVEQSLCRAQVHSAVQESILRLPDRLRRVMVAAYGLDGQPPRSLAAIGRQFGVTREAVRQWRNNALLLLRLPAFSGHLRRVCDQDSRDAYHRTGALSRSWLRQRRGRDS